MSTTDQAKRADSPVLSNRPPEQPVPSRGRYALMAAVAVVAAVGTALGVSADPVGAIFALFWFDVFIAFSVPLAVWATRPRSVHWVACIAFAVFMLGVAALSLLYVAAVGASV